MADLVFAKVSIVVGWKAGAIMRLKRGAAWAADDPFVKAHPELFATEPARVHRSTPDPRPRPFEDAEATPGRKRSL